MAYPKRTERYRCLDGHEHPIAPGSWRSLQAMAKRDGNGPETRARVRAGLPFMLCPAGRETRAIQERIA